ncbi:MAG: nucleotide-diphospho-sugar transferase [Elusimicrobiota bacterium]
MNTPVLFIFFKNKTTKIVFESIKKNRPLKIYLCSDGPRKRIIGEDEEIYTLRKYILQNINWECEVKTLFREHNLGAKVNIFLAIKWFFVNEEKGIVLEEDTLPSESFFEFCDELLEYYKNDKRVGMISGFNPFSSDLSIKESYTFSKYNLCWGWASWRRVFREYDLFINEFEKKKDKVLNNFNNNIVLKYYWENLFYMSYYGLDDSWDAQVSYLMYKNNMLTIYPKNNLIKNIGYNKFAIHCCGKPPLHISKAIIEKMSFPIKFNMEIKNNIILDKYIEMVHFEIFFYVVIKLKIKYFLARYFPIIFPFIKNIYKLLKKNYENFNS